MAKYRGRACVFGTLDAQEWEYFEAANDEKANEHVAEMAIIEYQMYEGRHGIRTRIDIEEEEECSEEEADELYWDDVSSWTSFEYERVE